MADTTVMKEHSTISESHIQINKSVHLNVSCVTDFIKKKCKGTVNAMGEITGLV